MNGTAWCVGVVWKLIWIHEADFELLYPLSCHQPTFPFCNKEGLRCVHLCPAHAACKWVSVLHLASKIWLRGWADVGTSTWYVHCSLAAISQLLVLEPWKTSQWWKRNSRCQEKEIMQGKKKRKKKKRANVNGFLMAVLLVQQLMH